MMQLEIVRYWWIRSIIDVIFCCPYLLESRFRYFGTSMNTYFKLDVAQWVHLLSTECTSEWQWIMKFNSH